MSRHAFSAVLRTAALVLAASLARAQDRVELVKGVTGPTLEAAVTQGLVRALEQVKGVRVDSALGLRLKHEAETLEVQEGAESWFAHASGDEVQAGTIARETNGLIRGYRILRQEEDPRTRAWTLDLEVTVPVYDPANPRPGARRTLAVLGFRAPDTTFDLAGVPVPAHEIGRKLVDQTQERFVKARKFLVLERGLAPELDKERARIAAADVPLAEQVKLGNQLGADLVLFGSVEEFSWETVPVRVELTGYESTRTGASYDVSFKLLDVATGEIRWAHTLRRIFGDEELKNLSPRDQAENLRIADFLVSKAAGALAASVLDLYYPIQVAGIDEATKEVVLAAGNTRVEPGERFGVFAPGQTFTDPTTGEPIGAGEERVATLAIVRVEPLMSRALVLSGDHARIKTGALCRRLEANEE